MQVVVGVVVGPMWLDGGMVPEADAPLSILLLALVHNIFVQARAQAKPTTCCLCCCHAGKVWAQTARPLDLCARRVHLCMPAHSHAIIAQI